MSCASPVVKITIATSCLPFLMASRYGLVSECESSHTPTSFSFISNHDFNFRRGNARHRHRSFSSGRTCVAGPQYHISIFRVNSLTSIPTAEDLHKRMNSIFLASLRRPLYSLLSADYKRMFSELEDLLKSKRLNPRKTYCHV